MNMLMPHSLPIAIALIADGTAIVITAKLYRGNMEIVSEFRDELRKFNYEKKEYGFVIPIYRNPEEVNKCLDDLIRRVGVPNSQIVAVDDFSNDEGQTKRVAEKYGVEVLEISREEKDVRKVRAQRKGVRKWLEREKKYVVCLDSDCYIKTDLSNLELAMAEMDFFGLDAMAGQVLPRIDKNSNLLERIQYVEYKQAMRAGRGFMYSLKKHHNGRVFSICDLKKKYSINEASQLCISGAFGIFNLKLLSEVLDEIKVYGGGEDAEITLRLLAKKAKIGYNNGIVVETEVPDKLSTWFRQRDFWSQFTSSYFFDSDYIWNIFKKKDSQWKLNYDLGSLSFGVRILRDVTHPIRIASFPFLTADLFSFVVFIATYFGMSWYCSAIIKGKKEKVDWHAELLLPLYRLGLLIGPMTIGYVKQFFRIFNPTGRSKNT